MPPDGLAQEPQPAPLTPREKKLVKNLTGLYTGVGAVVSSFQPLAGAIVLGGAPDRAEEVVKWARHNPDVMERLEKFTTANDLVNMILGHAAMAFAILVAVDRIQVGPRSAAMLQAFGYGELLKFKVQKAEAADVEEAAAA